MKIIPTKWMNMRVKPLLLLVPHLYAASGATCGGGIVGDGICVDGTCCSQYGWCGTSFAHCSGTGTCGGGSVGDGICADGTCCSQHGWCGVTPEYCSGSNPHPIGSPTQAPMTFAPAIPVDSTGDSRMVAFVGNWQPCPTEDQVAQYSHILIAFAVAFTDINSAVCTPTCDIPEPVICNNATNPDLVGQWQAAGKKVLLSFGGALMGGIWLAAPNGCWENCFGREAKVVEQLTDHVTALGLDGVDIDYEYYLEDSYSFAKGRQAQHFLKTITQGLRSSLPAGSLITHAPMDKEIVPGKAYYDILLQIANDYVDFLMPQYYNGVTRPQLDGLAGTGVGRVSALAHYTTLVENLFLGDPQRVVFGFCITECSGTNSNINGPQAAAIMSDLLNHYECNGGAFFWVAHHDQNGAWSTAVNTVVQSNAGCSRSQAPTPRSPSRNPTATSPSVSRDPTAAPTDPESHEPVPDPTLATTKSPVSPTNAESQCCDRNETRMKAYNSCTQYYWCDNGEVLPDLFGPIEGALFDETVGKWNHADNVTCNVNSCAGTSSTLTPVPYATEAPVPDPTEAPTASHVRTPTHVPAPSPSPVTDPTSAPVDPPTLAPTITPTVPTEVESRCCDRNETRMKAYNSCTQYYWCQHGEVLPDLYGPIDGYLFDESIGNWNHTPAVNCVGNSCGGTNATIASSTSSSGTESPGTESQCCNPGETRMKPYNGCTQWYWCSHGNVLPTLYGPIYGYLFDETIQNWNYEHLVTCSTAISC